MQINHNPKGPAMTRGEIYTQGMQIASMSLWVVKNKKMVLMYQLHNNPLSLTLPSKELIRQMGNIKVE